MFYIKADNSFTVNKVILLSPFNSLQTEKKDVFFITKKSKREIKIKEKHCLTNTRLSERKEILYGVIRDSSWIPSNSSSQSHAVLQDGQW